MGTILSTKEQPRSQTTPPAWRLTREALRRRPVGTPGQSRPLRLGTGGELIAIGSDAPTGHARQLFLDSVRDVAPEVLRDLADTPLDAFLATFLQFATVPSLYFMVHAHRASSWLLPSDAVPAPIVLGESVPVPSFLTEERERRIALLRDWARRWELHTSVDDWLLWTAAETVLWWCQCRAARESESVDYLPDDGREWWHGGHLEPIQLRDDEKRVAFPAFDWDPQLELKADAAKRIGTDLDRILHEQLDDIESHARGRDMVRPVTKATGSEHFRWLVRWQVRRESYREIADSTGDRNLTQNAIQLAVRETALLVGLTRRRPNPPGAPRKLRRPHIIKVASPRGEST